MKYFIFSFSLLALAGIPVSAAALYDNTTTDTLGTLFYSAGPYNGIGDQIRLTAATPVASKAQLQMFNLGGAGTFNALLRFYEIGPPIDVLGPFFTKTGIRRMVSTSLI